MISLISPKITNFVTNYFKMKPQRIITLALTALLAVVPALAQIFTPVKWSTKIEMTGESKGEIVFTAAIENGWHVYSNDIDPNVGPSPLTIEYDVLKGVKLDGKLKPSKAPHAEYDNMFEAELRWWTDNVTLRQAFTATAADFTIDGTIGYAACNDENCIPPSREPFSLSGKAKIAKPFLRQQRKQRPNLRLFQQS